MLNESDWNFASALQFATFINQHSKHQDLPIFNRQQQQKQHNIYIWPFHLFNAFDEEGENVEKSSTLLFLYHSVSILCCCCFALMFIHFSVSFYYHSLPFCGYYNFIIRSLASLTLLNVDMFNAWTTENKRIDIISDYLLMWPTLQYKVNANEENQEEEEELLSDSDVYGSRVSYTLGQNGECKDQRTQHQHVNCTTDVNHILL